MVNRYGQVIGINTLSTNADKSATNISFSIAINHVQAYVDKVIQESNDRGQRQWYDLAMNLDPIRGSENIERYYKQYGLLKGMVVLGVEPESPAARIGVRAGDLITQVNGSDVTYPADLCTLLSSTSSGAKVKLLRLEDKDNVELEGIVAIGNIATSQSLTVLAETNRTSRFAVERDNFRTGATFWPKVNNNSLQIGVEAEVYKVSLNVNTEIPIQPIAPSQSTDTTVSANVIFIDQGRAGVAVGLPDISNYIACWISNMKQFGCTQFINGSPMELSTVSPLGVLIPTLVQQTLFRSAQKWKRWSLRLMARLRKLSPLMNQEVYRSCLYKM